MKYRQNVLLKNPSSKYLRSEDCKGVAKFICDKESKIEVSAVGVSGENLCIKYSTKDFSVRFPYHSGKNEEFILGKDVPTGGGLLLFDELNSLPILYGAFSSAAPSYTEMLENSPERYDDEVVATENYYEYEKEIEDKQLIEGDNLDDGYELSNENEMSEKENGRERSKIENKESAHENEYGFGNEKINLDGENYYYLKIKDELDKIMKENKEETSLSEIVKDSKWVKIVYGEGKYYVVGVIYDKGAPKWICYGVPGVYGEKPSELKAYCSFIPSSVFNLKSSGYWVMYQDASNGKILE